jgi:hypothetical protein
VSEHLAPAEERAMKNLPRWLFVFWPALLFPATVAFGSLYDPTRPDAPLPFAFAPARFAAMIFSWPMALVVAPMAAGFVLAQRAWARGGFSLGDRFAMVWFLMSATWFHIGCDVFSGLLQVMPSLSDAYRGMNAANLRPLHHPDRVVLDVVYWFELFVQAPLAALTFWLYATRSRARPAVECFLCGLHVVGTVAYYVPDIVLGQTTHPLLTNMDRALASLWIWVPSALALRATRSAARAGRGALSPARESP